MSRVVERKLAELIAPRIETVAVEPDDDYRIAGVYGFGRGVFGRGPITGAQTSYTKLNRLRSGMLVMSRLKAFEGAIAIVTDEFDGWFVSQEFPTFEADEDRLALDYLSFICRWPKFWARLSGASKGIGARRERVNADQLLDVAIPWMSLDEQRRVAERLGRIGDEVSGVRRRMAQSKVLVEASKSSLVESIFSAGIEMGWPMRPLSDVAMINPKRTRLQPDDQVAFVPMPAVDALTGSVQTPEVRSAGHIGPGYKQFARGDVIFARITPCMQNGKCAVFDGPSEYGFGSTEFHVVRAGPEADPRWLHRIMRSPDFRRRAAARFKGTAGQQRVPTDFLETVSIPVPPLAEQSAAIRELDRVADLGFEITGKQSAAKQLIDALLPSALNEAFSGLG